jgi:hypothetical protein
MTDAEEGKLDVFAPERDCGNGVSIWDRASQPDVLAFLTGLQGELLVCKSSGLQSTRTALLTLKRGTWISQDVLYDVAVLCLKHRKSRAVMPLSPFFYSMSLQIIDYSLAKVSSEVTKLEERNELDTSLLYHLQERLHLPFDRVARFLCLHRLIGKTLGVKGRSSSMYSSQGVYMV